LQHPGGSELIEEFAGKDSDAKKMLKKYLIGELEDVSISLKLIKRK